MTTWGMGRRWLVVVAAVGAPLLVACGANDQGTGSSSASESQSGGATEYGWLAPLPTGSTTGATTGGTTTSTGSSSDPCSVSRTDPSWSYRCGADAGAGGTSGDGGTTGAGGSSGDGAGGSSGDGATTGSGGAGGYYDGCGSSKPPKKQ